MGLFGRSPDERLAAAAHALHPYGFVLDRRYAPGLRQYEPFTLFSTPEEYVAGAVGAIEGFRVELYEYGYTYRDSEGNDSYYSALAVALHHPWVSGGASFAPDHKEWGGAASVIDALLWIPPFTIVKAFQLVMASRNPDRNVGDADFDRLYNVRADSDAAARRAISPPLREVCLRLQFRGSVELRPGVLLYSPRESHLDERTSVPAIGVGAAFLAALAPRGAHPMR